MILVIIILSKWMMLLMMFVTIALHTYCLLVFVIYGLPYSYFTVLQQL